MRRTKNGRKLQLNKETIRVLSSRELARVAGGQEGAGGGDGNNGGAGAGGSGHITCHPCPVPPAGTQSACALQCCG
jgi:natural product precursor